MRGTRKIDWLNHFLEFIVVIIGILIAFQLNTCSQERKEATLVQQHIDNVIAETELNRENLSNSIAETEALKNNIDTLLAEIKNEGALQKINMLSMKTMALNNNYFKKNAYNSLIASGDIRFIENFELKDDVITLYEYYKWAEGMDEMTRTSYIQFFYPYAVDNFDLTGATPQNIEVYNNKRYKNILAAFRYTLNVRAQQHKQTLEKINSFLEKYPRS